MTAPDDEFESVGSRDSPWPAWVETWVLPYLREEALWPVLVALLGHVVVAIAPVLLYVIRDRSSAAVAILFLLAAVTGYPAVFEIQHLGRPSLVTVVVGLIWASSAVLAGVTGYYGVL